VEQGERWVGDGREAEVDDGREAGSDLFVPIRRVAAPPDTEG